MTRLSRYEKRKYDKLPPHKRRLVRKMQEIDIVNPVMVLEEAEKLNSKHVPLSLACSVLIQETGGGKNIYGSDTVKSPQLRTWSLANPRKVTRLNYAIYKRLRKLGYGMQGVGPLQLTWYELQDQADKIGGCWRPRYNVRVGLGQLQALIARHGKAEGVKRYNGSGPAADRYARQVLTRADAIHRRFV